MDPDSTLELIAQLAVAIAGFSSVVVAFGQRRERGWNRADRIRLSLLVGDSLAVMFFALLPLVLMIRGEEGAVTWAVASLTLALYVLVRGLLLLPRVRGHVGRERDALHPAVVLLTGLCFAGVLALQAFNLIGTAASQPWPVVAGLWLLLSVASVQFLRLVFTQLDR